MTEFKLEELDRDYLAFSDIARETRIRGAASVKIGSTYLLGRIVDRHSSCPKRMAYMYTLRMEVQNL